MFLSLSCSLDLEIFGVSLPGGASLGKKLRALRKRKGLSIRQLAATVDISPTTILALETAANVQTSVALRTATALGAGLFLWPKGEPQPSFYKTTALSSSHEGWTTPPEVVEKLKVVIDGIFDLDPCSPDRKSKSAVRARIRFTKDDNGLLLPWFGTVFINPPYSRALISWIAKAHSETSSGNAKAVVALIPSRTDTLWWHKHIAGHADVWMLKGRLSFGADGTVAPFPSAIVIWNATEAHREAMNRLFVAWHVPSAKAAA